MMTKTLMILAETAFVTWVLILAASLMRARAWTPAGMMVAFGNREHMAECTGLVARTDRAGRNMLENLVLFTALVLVASVAGVNDPQVELGARIFFWARIVYIPIYMLGIPVVRTLTYVVSMVGLGLIFVAIARVAYA